MKTSQDKIQPLNTTRRLLQAMYPQNRYVDLNLYCQSKVPSNGTVSERILKLKLRFWAVRDEDDYFSLLDNNLRLEELKSNATIFQKAEEVPGLQPTGLNLAFEVPKYVPGSFVEFEISQGGVRIPDNSMFKQESYVIGLPSP